MEKRYELAKSDESGVVVPVTQPRKRGRNSVNHVIYYADYVF